jgi:hypothetical protein
MAQDATATAEALFEQGRQELAAGNYANACTKLRRSDELDPALGTKLNLGECEALRGNVATAWELFRHVEARLAPDDIRLPVASGKRVALEPRLPRLVVTLAGGFPPDARVHAGRRIIQRSELGLPIFVDPGPVEVVVTAPGYAEQRKRVTVEEGKTQDLVFAPEIAPLALARPQSMPTAPRPTDVGSRPLTPIAPVTPKDAPASPSRRAGIVFLGIGIGGAVVAGIAGIMTLDAKRTNEAHCPELTRSCDQTGRDAASRGRLLGAITTAGFVVGGAGIGIGTYLLVKRGQAAQQFGSVSLRCDGVGSKLVFERSF